ncbi:MAG: hypothetical protein IKK36_11580 [Bacteroidales bacterium]|nr:hypothetical protein [Bacteroidales bacterium]
MAKAVSEFEDFENTAEQPETFKLRNLETQKQSNLETIKNKKTALASGFSIFDCIDYSTTICST